MNKWEFAEEGTFKATSPSGGTIKVYIQTCCLRNAVSHLAKEVLHNFCALQQDSCMVSPAAEGQKNSLLFVETGDVNYLHGSRSYDDI